MLFKAKRKGVMDQKRKAVTDQVISELHKVKGLSLREGTQDEILQSKTGKLTNLT